MLLCTTVPPQSAETILVSSKRTTTVLVTHVARTVKTEVAHGIDMAALAPVDDVGEHLYSMLRPGRPSCQGNRRGLRRV